jgi:hypothetical protein
MESYTQTSSDFERSQTRYKLRNKVMSAALRVHLEFLDSSRVVGAEIKSIPDLDAAVLELAKELRPIPMTKVVVKVEGDLSEEAANDLRRALDRSVLS